MRTILTVMILALLFSLPVFGGDFGLNAEVRHRYELDAKDFNSDTGFNNNGYLRSRLGASFMPTENITAYLQIQDWRKLGSETSTFDSDADNLDLHQGFLQVENFYDLPLGFKLGRMEAKYSNERLIGAVGWRNDGRVFDGIEVSWDNPYSNVRFFNYKEVEQMLPSDLGDKNVLGAWVTPAIAGQISPEFNIIWQREQGSGMLSRLNIGTNLGFNLGGINGMAEVNYQTGQIDADRDISAYMFALNGSYSLGKTGWAPAVSLGIDYLSGDSDPADDTFEVFDTMYATNHKYYGISDFFINIPADTYGGGLSDIHAGLSFNPCERSVASLRFHNFTAVEELGGETAFGNEIDLIFNTNYNEYLNFEGGFSYFMPGKIFENVRGEDASMFGYIQTRFSF